MNERLLRFHDQVIEKKYYEDEYFRIIQTFKLQIYLGLLISAVLVIFAFINGQFDIYLGSMVPILLFPLLIMILAKKFPYYCNILVSFNNVIWCILICAVYIWHKDSIMEVCSKNYNEEDNASCSYLFILGGGFYTLHIALLIGTNFILNACTFLIINTIYVFSVFPSIVSLLCLIILSPMCILVTVYLREKNTRLYYSLVNKYYIWYHIANYVIPQKIIITKSLEKGKDQYQLYKTNRSARREYNINNNDDLYQFIGKIDLKEDTHQQIHIYDDMLNHNNHGDSLHSKSLGIISQISKKSFSPLQSNKLSTKLISLEFLLRREIRRQNSYDMQEGQGDPTANNQQNLNANQININGNGFLNSNLNNKNLNTTMQEIGAQPMRNKNRSLFQMEDQGLQSIANPSFKNRKSTKTMRRTKVEKYKGIFKNDTEEKRKFQLSLACYSKDEQYQLIVIEEEIGIQKDEILDEQMSLYKNFAVNFASMIQKESNLLQHYIQQMKQNYQIQKKIKPFLCEASSLNLGLNYKIYNFQEFFNLESNKLIINPKQFSLKKLIKEIASSQDFRIKQNQIQLIISNECPPEQDIIFNDEKRIKHIINFLLNDCINQTQKGQIVISTSPGATEMGDLGDIALQDTIKIHVRDNSMRKYQPNKIKNDYIFQANNLPKILKNKSQSYSDIEFSVCKQILKIIGPQGNLFYLSEDKNNTNKVSFYIYTNIQDGQDYYIINGKDDDFFPDQEEDEPDEEEDDNFEFQAQIQNSDDDTYKNNNDQSPIQENNYAENQNNYNQSSNQNPSSIYIQHGVESRNNNQGSGFQFSSQYQIQQLGAQQQPQNNNFEKYQQQHSIQQQSNQSGVNQNYNSLISSHLQMQQSEIQFLQSSSQNGFDKHPNLHSFQIQTQPERNDKKIGYLKKQSELRKSTSQLFDEADKIEDENPVSEVYIKELSQTSVKFKRDIQRKMSQKTNLFKSSMEDIEFNSKVNSISKINNPIILNQIRNNAMNNISKSIQN